MCMRKVFKLTLSRTYNHTLTDKLTPILPTYPLIPQLSSLSSPPHTSNFPRLHMLNSGCIIKREDPAAIQLSHHRHLHQPAQTSTCCLLLFMEEGEKSAGNLQAPVSGGSGGRAELTHSLVVFVFTNSHSPYSPALLMLLTT